MAQGPGLQQTHRLCRLNGLQRQAAVQVPGIAMTHAGQPCRGALAARATAAHENQRCMALGEPRSEVVGKLAERGPDSRTAMQAGRAAHHLFDWFPHIYQSRFGVIQQELADFPRMECPPT